MELPSTAENKPFRATFNAVLDMVLWLVRGLNGQCPLETDGFTRLTGSS